MAAAAVSSLACPLRRSSRLTSRRTKLDHIHPDDSSDDPENELTPRALRALKRQRLALDLHPRPRKRRKENLPLHTKSPDPIKDPPRPLPLPLFPDPAPSPSTSPEPITPLTPLSSSPESSPSLPGHDRPTLPPSPPLEPTPLEPSLDSLIPFDPLHPHFPTDLPPTQPQLQALELQDQFHSFSQPQLYVPPPVFVRDREINIWKLACQERVDCLLRRYGIDYIKALVQSEARSLTHNPPSTSQTKFRLYTPASYTYSSTSWPSSSAPRKPFPLDDDAEDPDAPWPIDDADWVDADVDMEDDDEDDYEDEDDTAEAEAEREGETTLEAVQDLVSADTASMQVDESRPPTKSPPTTDAPHPPPPNTALRPLTPSPHVYLPPPPLTPPSLPPLSSLHVPLLSEPPRAFMGRGTPPDRRRLIEWSGSGRFATNGMGPPLYLSPVPQRHPTADVGIIPMSVDAPMHSPSQPAHANGEWTSFLFSVLEGDGVGVGSSVANPPHSSWYELGLAVPALPTARTPAVEQSVEEGNTSSSTLRFALG